MIASQGAATVRALLRDGRARGASDLIMRAGLAAYYKIDGSNTESVAVPGGEDMLAFVREHAAADSRMGLFEGKRAIGFAAQHLDFGRVRVQAAIDLDGLSLTFRFIPRAIPQLASLGLPQAVVKLGWAKGGLILITGPVGSGKSTLQAAFVQDILVPRGLDVITAEDPPEYLFRHERVRQYGVGTELASFFEACLHELRCNAGAFILGEVRDHATAAAMLLAAETGALVIATLHTSRTVDAADRLLAFFPAHERDLARTQLSHTLVAVIGPRLVKKKGGGRRAAVELLPATPGVKLAIREANTKALEDIMDAPGESGAFALEQNLAALVHDESGIAAEDALEAANDRQRLERLLERRQTRRETQEVFG
ncbi:hypothetical protein EPN42_13075 [bacterium]|nr:MAG: hypothetical protein EPN42_13075 [bacterium]